MQGKTISGNIVNIFKKEIFPGKLFIENGKIVSIKNSCEVSDQAILPGLIDAHVHIESSMMAPLEFARAAVRHGTVACISDPHEIANVLGIEGINYMIENGQLCPFKFYFGAPSCVPATTFETSGSTISSEDIAELIKREDIICLSEVMNYPGVISRDPEIMEKIRLAREQGKVIDGHAPGLRGRELKEYIAAGINTDHECVSKEEAIEKINAGMKILIREGSAAKNLSELLPLIEAYPEKVMLCTDDIHPDDLMEGHINKLVKYGIMQGVDKFKMIAAATKNPAEHYGLDIGLLREGDPADFIIIDSLENFKIIATYIKGDKQYENGQTLIDPVPVTKPNSFNSRRISADNLAVPARSNKLRVIKLEEGNLITDSLICRLEQKNGVIIPDLANDILKLVVLDRYSGRAPETGFISGFGIKKGAIASSISHDSHNIIAVGSNDEDLCHAINKVIECKGALVVSEGGKLDHLALPVAGLMSDNNIEFVAGKYAELEKRASSIGSVLKSTFMSLSFMALLVIPKLKLSDKGLFDSEHFEYTSLYV